MGGCAVLGAGAEGKGDEGRVLCKSLAAGFWGVSLLKSLLMPARKIIQWVIGVLLFCTVTGVTARAGAGKGMVARGGGGDRTNFEGD